MKEQHDRPDLPYLINKIYRIRLKLIFVVCIVLFIFISINFINRNKTARFIGYDQCSTMSYFSHNKSTGNNLETHDVKIIAKDNIPEFQNSILKSKVNMSKMKRAGIAVNIKNIDIANYFLNSIVVLPSKFTNDIVLHGIRAFFSNNNTCESVILSLQHKNTYKNGSIIIKASKDPKYLFFDVGLPDSEKYEYVLSDIKVSVKACEDINGDGLFSTYEFCYEDAYFHIEAQDVHPNIVFVLIDSILNNQNKIQYTPSEEELQTIMDEVRKKTDGIKK